VGAFDCGNACMAMKALQESLRLLSHLMAMQLWIANLAFASLVNFLVLGFELGLYDSCEYASIFWYCSFLLDQQQALLRQLAVARPKELKGAPAKKQPKASGKKKGKQKAAPDPVLTPGAFQAACDLRSASCFLKCTIHHGAT
jgi:hypothetical protein